MKTLIIADSTARQTIRQPLLFVIVIGGAVMILVMRAVTFFTFGQEEQLNMMREMGLATITMSGLLFTIFAAALSITEDLERRSAITVLCKPVQRYEYVLGKFLGISFTIFCVYFFLTVCLLFSLWLSQTHLKLGEMFHESVTSTLYYALGDFVGYCRFFAPDILKGVVLSYFEIILLNSISLAVATRLPILVNLSIVSIIFIIGNLSDFLYLTVMKNVTGDVERVSSYGLLRLFSEFPSLGIAKLFYILIPNLESFNISNAVAYQLYVSPKYVFLTVGYGLVYTVIALTTALFSFEHRELM